MHRCYQRLNMKSRKKVRHHCYIRTWTWYQLRCADGEDIRCERATRRTDFCTLPESNGRPKIRGRKQLDFNSLPGPCCATIVALGFKPHGIRLSRPIPSRCIRLAEEPGSKIVQASPPCQPFVRGSRGFEVDVVNTGLREHIAEILSARTLGGPDTQEQYFHLLVE